MLPKKTELSVLSMIQNLQFLEKDLKFINVFSLLYSTNVLSCFDLKAYKVTIPDSPFAIHQNLCFLYIIKTYVIANIYWLPKCQLVLDPLFSNTRMDWNRIRSYEGPLECVYELCNHCDHQYLEIRTVKSTDLNLCNSLHS